MKKDLIKKEYVICEKYGDGWSETHKLKTKEELNKMIEKLKKIHFPFDRHLKVCTYKTYCKHQYEMEISGVFKTITFGKWERPLTWTVIDEDDKKKLLLCDTCVERRIFDEDSSCYRVSEIRSWLNNHDATYNNSNKDYTKIGFLNAFTCEEINRLERFCLVPWSDYIGLLSCEEYEKYKEKIPKVNSAWWLRPPGLNTGDAAIVSSGGYVDDFGLSVGLDYFGVRPALWLRK